MGSKGTKEVQKYCARASDEAGTVLNLATKSKQGRYDRVPTDQRIQFLVDARKHMPKMNSSLAKAQEAKGKIDNKDISPEDALDAEMMLVTAIGDVEKAGEVFADARESLQQGLLEMEAFYGASHKTVRQIRKQMDSLA